jgi:hypothetical protein
MECQQRGDAFGSPCTYMRPWLRSAEWTCLILVLLAATSGCSAMILGSGHEDALASAQEGGTRAQIRNRLGSPADTGTCPDGRPFDRFRVRQPIPELAEALYIPARGQGLDRLFWLVFEPIFTPIAAIASEVKKVPVTAVYGLDERFVYAFTNRQEWRFYEAVQPLTAEVRSSLRQSEPSTWILQVTVYINELRRRAACTGTTLVPEDEAALAELIPIVEEGMWGIATPDEALGKFDEMTWRIYGRIRS